MNTTQIKNPYTNKPIQTEINTECNFEQELNPEIFEHSYKFLMNEEDEFRIIARISETFILYTDNLGEETKINIHSFAGIMEPVDNPKHKLHKDYIFIPFNEEEIIDDEEVEILEIQNDMKKLHIKIKKNQKEFEDMKNKLKKLKLGERGEDISEEVWAKLKNEIRAFRNGKVVVWESHLTTIEVDGTRNTPLHKVSKDSDFNMFYKYIIVT